MDSLSDMIRDIALNMSNIKELMPKIYLNLEDVIEENKLSLNPPAISWFAFTKMAAEANFKDEEQLFRATQFLNDLGSLVFFEDDKTRERLIVLDPQWLTSMFASVITTKHKLIKDGILYHDDLGQIWRAPQYPESLHQQLLSLLDQFGILFRLPDEIDEEGKQPPKKRYILPSLLPEEAPRFDFLWLKYEPNVVQFSRFYTLEFIPNGFFSRLMVRFLHYIDTPLKYWRNGVLASLNQDKALIQLVDKVLKVEVRGPKCSEILRIITELVDSLLNSWFKIKTMAIEIPCPHCISILNGEPSKTVGEVLEDKEKNGDQNSVTMFSFSKLEEIIASSDERTIKCKNQVSIRLDSLVPDLVMADFGGHQLNYHNIIVEKQLGKGSYGIIYKARLNDEVVALKTIKGGEDAQVAAFAEFRREVWLMSGLEHPCIVNLRGYTLNPLSMVMECVPGGDLFGFLHNPDIEMDWQLRLKIALDIASGMSFLHNINPPFLHRDMKSPNCLIVDHKRGSPVVCKVADFGLSSRLFAGQLSDRAVENPTWCAPEVMKKKPYTEKADVYSYGIILWELLTRKMPFDNYTFQHQLEDDIFKGLRPLIPEDCIPEYANLMRACWDENASIRPSFDRILEVLLAIIRSEFGEQNFQYPLLAFQRKKKVPNSKTQQVPQTIITADLSKIVGDLQTTLVVPFSSHSEDHTPISTSSSSNPQSASVQVIARVSNQIWCGDKSGTISIFSAENGRLLSQYKNAHKGPVRVIQQIDTKVWTGAEDGILIIWKIEDLVSEANSEIIICEGSLLTKSGGGKAFLKKWIPKWVTLDKKGFFKIYASKGANEAEVEFNLFESIFELKNKNSFFIKKKDNQKISLQSKNEEELSLWIAEINQMLSKTAKITRAQESIKRLNVSDKKAILSIALIEENIFVGSNHSTIKILDPLLRSKTVQVPEEPFIGSSSSSSSSKDISILHFIDTTHFIWVTVNNGFVRLNPSVSFLYFDCTHMYD